MWKAMSKKVGTGGRFDIFLDSGESYNPPLKLPGSAIHLYSNIRSIHCIFAFSQFREKR